MLRWLNAGDETPGGVEYYTLAGVVDGRGDGVVLAPSVPVAGAAGHRNVTCGHNELKQPRRCPAGYAFVQEALSVPAPCGRG